MGGVIAELIHLLENKWSWTRKRKSVDFTRSCNDAQYLFKATCMGAWQAWLSLISEGVLLSHRITDKAAPYSVSPLISPTTTFTLMTFPTKAHFSRGPHENTNCQIRVKPDRNEMKCSPHCHEVSMHYDHMLARNSVLTILLLNNQTASCWPQLSGW